METLTKKLEQYVYPIAAKFQENKFLMSIQYGMMLTTPLLLVGAFACIISDFPLDAFQTFMIGIFGEEVWGDWNWSILNPATIGLLSLVAMSGTSYELARRNDVPAMPAVVISFMCFFLLIHADENGMISLSNFTATTLFLSLFIAILTGQLYAFFIKRNLTIKMPAAVPEFIASQFAALIPAAVCAILFIVLRYLIAATPFVTASDLFYGILQMPLAAVGTTLPGTLIATFLNDFLWFFGIHGTNVVMSVMQPLWEAARSANLEVYTADALALRPFVVTTSFTDMIIFLTGTGLTLPLCIEMVFMCKSERLNAVGKGAIIPGIFNVNEPITFGLPIVLNPMLLIPYVFGPMICVALAYIAMETGIVPRPTGVPVPWTLPAPFGGWMMCGDWRGGALQLVILTLQGLFYWPFIKVLDKKYVEEEQELAEGTADVAADATAA